MEYIFERKIYNKILNWKLENNGRTALLIEGARRVGKSTIVKEFAQREYESFIFIDFNSLDAFCAKYSNRIGNRYLIYTKDLEKNGETQLLPTYLTPFI